MQMVWLGIMAWIGLLSSKMIFLLDFVIWLHGQVLLYSVI